MAITCAVRPTGNLTLEAYVEWLCENVDFSDEASILESAPRLAELGLNRRLFENIIREPLEQMASERGSQAQNRYTDASIMLQSGVGLPFFVRANIWKKPRERGGSLSFENRLYAYHHAHDHNFEFLTVGYHGSGYRTRIYEYDPHKVEGTVGERVDLNFLEDTTLPEGKVMFFRKSVDVHEQLAPEELSISLNLMVPSRDRKVRQQFQFDLENSKIIQYVNGAVGSRVQFIEIASALGDENTAEYLFDIAHRSPCQRSRASAYSGLLRLAPSARDRTLGDISADPSVLVRALLSDGPH